MGISFFFISVNINEVNGANSAANNITFVKIEETSPKTEKTLPVPESMSEKIPITISNHNSLQSKDLKEEKKLEQQKVKIKEELEKAAPKLKGLTFLPYEDHLQPVLILSRGIVIDEISLPDKKAFVAKMRPFLGKPITSEVLSDLKKTIINYYWEQGYPLVRVIIPIGQDITEGKVQVIIVSARLGKVKIEGKKYTSDEKLKKAIRLQPGDEIESKLLMNDAAWLEGDPFRTVDIIYEQGEDLGTTDIVLHVDERFPLTVYTGYENNPYKSAGSSRFKTGFHWGHLFWQDQQINFEFISAEKIDRWFSVSGNYIIPLPWRDQLKFFYNYIRSKATSEDLNIAIGSKPKGEFWQLGARYNLQLSGFVSYKHLIQFGYDFKRSNNLLEYYGYNVGRTQADISQFLVRYEATETDKTGRTFFGFSVYISPGGMTAFNRNHFFREQRSGANSDYYYFLFNLDRYQHLGRDWSWTLSTIIQMSSGKLLATEEFSLGGHLTVRGYLENEVLGDRGMLLKNEIRTPSISFKPSWKDEFQLLAFVDFGFLNEVDQNVLSKDTSVLLSAGPGALYKISQYVNVRCDAGFQMKSVHGKLFGKNLHRRVHLAAFLTF